MSQEWGEQHEGSRAGKPTEKENYHGADIAIAWYQKNPIMKSVAFLNALKNLTEPNPPLVENPQYGPGNRAAKTQSCKASNFSTGTQFLTISA